MKRIYKYELEENSVEMPIGAKILSIQMQNNRAYIWALVDTDAECEFRYFVMIGTGHDFPQVDAFTYINTIQDGRFVWHIFELVKKEIEKL
jgi:hypothetical protein